MHPSPYREALFLALIIEQLPSSREGVVMRKASPSGHCDKTPIRADAAASDRPIGGEVIGGYFDVLPDVRLGIDDTHVWLVSAPVDECSIFQLKEGMIRVVLYSGQTRRTV
jgi:hypothetical protein